MSAGWQSKPSPEPCLHLGLLAAGLSLYRYPVGAVWKCTCGKAYRVMRADSGQKQLRSVL